MRMPNTIILSLIAFVGLLAATGGCRSEMRERAAITEALARPTMDVAPAAVTPRIDASPDDPAWRSATVIPSLALSPGPESKNLQAVPTEVRLLWDEDFLYVRFTMRDNEIYAPFEGRDQLHYQGDVVEFFIDGYGDGRQVIEIEVSPRNQIFDQLILLTADPDSNADGTLTREVRRRDLWMSIPWNLPGVRTAASITREGSKVTGWIADLEIPAGPVLRRLGLSKFKPMTLRAHMMRYEWVRSEVEGAPRQLITMNWAPVMWKQPHISPAGMGTLRLIGQPTTRPATTRPH